MTAVLSHRGPDDSGICANGYVGLGHQRLSIIDLTDAGHQPMANEDDSIQIVFNGEIYNFEELRKDLEKRATSSGPTQTRKPSFTFMKKKVQTALSSFGECLPLPCGTAAKTFCFYPVTGPVKNRWSIRKQIIVLFLLLKLNHSFRILQLFLKSKNEALHHFLTYQYVPGPLTVFKKIKKLPPAHSLILKNGNITIERYWNLSYAKDPDCKNLSTCCEKLVDVFTDAVKVRLRSDVPLGAFLSGGVDSSATVVCYEQTYEQTRQDIYHRL